MKILSSHSLQRLPKILEKILKFCKRKSDRLRWDIPSFFPDEFFFGSMSMWRIPLDRWEEIRDEKIDDQLIFEDTSSRISRYSDQTNTFVATSIVFVTGEIVDEREDVVKWTKRKTKQSNWSRMKKNKICQSLRGNEVLQSVWSDQKLFQNSRIRIRGFDHVEGNSFTQDRQWWPSKRELNGITTNGSKAVNRRTMEKRMRLVNRRPRCSQSHFTDHRWNIS